jgi:hypothetical protein
MKSTHNLFTNSLTISFDFSTFIKLIIATSIVLPLTLIDNHNSAQAQSNFSAIEPNGLQILQRGERDDRTRSMVKVGKCIDADGLEAALHHGIRAIKIDESNGYAYFCTGASMIIYKSKNAEDALPYLEHSYKLFRSEGDAEGLQMIVTFLERITNSNGL